MAYKYPLSSGNWSNASIWNGGTVPTSDDVAFLNGYTVTADTNISVDSLDFRAISGESKPAQFCAGVSGNTTRLRVNGGTESTAADPGTIVPGNNYYLSRYMTCELAEVIITTPALSDANRQLAEGYLAWKWGIVSDLPVDHPYKSSAPSGSWTPAQLSPTLWLDANDQSTITVTGGRVSQWNDKSGNARNATIPSGGYLGPLVRGASWLSGKKALYFDSYSALLGGTGLASIVGSSGNNFSIIVLFKLLIYSAYNNTGIFNNSMGTNGGNIYFRQDSATTGNFIVSGSIASRVIAYTTSLSTDTITSGGVLNVTDAASSGKSLTCVNNIISGSSGSGASGRVSVGTNYPNTYSISAANVYPGYTTGGGLYPQFGLIDVTGSGTLNLTFSGRMALYQRYHDPGLWNKSIGQVNIVGAIYQNWDYILVRNTGGGVLSVTGDVTNSAGDPGPINTAIYSTSGVVTVNGTVGPIEVYTANTQGSVTTPTIYITGGVLRVNGNLRSNIKMISPCINNAGGTLYANVNFTGSTNVNHVNVYSLSGMNYFSGPFPGESTGRQNIYCARWAWIYAGTLTPTYWRVRTYPLTADRNLYTTDNQLGGLPAVSNVRSGLVYGPSGGQLTGTCVVPAASNVAAGVAVDNTVGTAVLSPADVWNYPVSSISTANSIGLRVKRAASVDQCSAIVKGAFN